MKHKRILAVFCAAALFICQIPAMAQDIQVLLDGEPIVFDVAPATVNDRTFVPLRAVGEALGAIVDWNEEEQKVTLTREGVVNELVIGSLTAFRTNAQGAQEVTLDAAPFVTNDRTLVPIRYIAESFDMTVDWDEETQTVFITKPVAETEAETGTSNKKVIDFSGDADTTRKTLHHNIRYDFEQYALPQNLLATEYEDETINWLKNSPEELIHFIHYVWDYVVDVYLVQMMTESEETYDISSEEALSALLDELRSEYTLAADDVFTVSIDELSDGTPVVLLDLADIGTEALDITCSYIALTYQEETGFRYFTLETDAFADGLAVCEVTLTSRGTYYFIQDDKDLFLQAVEKILAEDAVPGAALIRDLN